MKAVWKRPFNRTRLSYGRIHVTQKEDNMRQKTLWILLGASGLLLLVLFTFTLVANFHMARSETQASATTASSRWPQEAVAPSQPVHFVVEGNGPLAEALTAALEREVPNANAASETAETNLIVQIDKAQINWTPVSGRAEIEVTAAFSSNEDFSFIEQRPFYFQYNNGDDQGAGYIVQSASEVRLTDRSNGLLSRPGYTQFLAEKIAAEINKALQTQVFAMP